MTLTRRTGEKILVGDFTIEILSIGARFARIKISSKAETKEVSIRTTVEVGDSFCFGGIVIGISEIQPLKKVMVFVQAPREIAILRAELVGRTPTSANPVLRRAISSIPGIH